ncbi:MAG: histidine phosphatase family protein [Candidatus Marsarchaeota archaeon]|nr:histidine phosphatase family protein [Candidatus Marsarchaeota archaeon]
MNIVIFVRHGQSESNVTHTLTSDIDKSPLTEEGIKQVEALAKTMPKGMKIDAFYTSPVLRAVQSAEILEKALGMKPKLDKRLWERHMGGLNNVTFGSEQEQTAAMMEEIRSGFKKGMESWDSMQGRLKDFAHSIKGVTVAVSHHDPILSAMGIVDSKYNDYDVSTHLPTASATAIDFGNKKILHIGSRTLPDL